MVDEVEVRHRMACHRLIQRHEGVRERWRGIEPEAWHAGLG